MAKQDGASFLQSQLKNVKSLVGAFQVMVQASAISSADASRLTALVQTSSDSDSDDEDSGAPAAAVYENHSGGIIETLEGLLEKAETQLDKARKTETSNLHNYEVMKQALTDEIKYGTEDLGKAQKCVSK